MIQQKFTIYPFKGKAFTLHAATLNATDDALSFTDNDHKLSDFYINKAQIVCIIPEKPELGNDKTITFIIQTIENNAPIVVKACSFLKSATELLFYGDKKRTPIANMFFNAAYVVAVYPSEFDER